MELIGQEVSGEPEIEIPDAVREVYRLWRPTPLFRARRLEQALGTPAHIYYKYEGVSPAGSHKPNTAVPQAYANAQAGIRKLTTETGAGQWGSSLAFACSLFDMECEVFMVGSSYDQKPYRRSMMQTWGATVHRSPSDLTESGRANADSPTGSLGIAISEAVEIAAQNEDTNYALGSVLNHVLLHQTIIGQETIAQMEMAGEEPDVIIGCVGGGSNFGGPDVPVDAAQAARRRLRPALPRGRAGRLPDADEGRLRLRLRRHRRADAAHADVHARPRLRPAARARRRPALPRRRADGLRAAEGRHASRRARIARTRRSRRRCEFARHEGIIPAPEPAHAIRAAIDEALAAKEAGEERVILFGLCGHGNFDLAAYDAYLAGTLEDPEFSQDDMDTAVAAAAGGGAVAGVAGPRSLRSLEAARCCTPTSQRGAGGLAPARLAGVAHERREVLRQRRRGGAEQLARAARVERAAHAEVRHERAGELLGLLVLAQRRRSTGGSASKASAAIVASSALDGARRPRRRETRRRARARAAARAARWRRCRPARCPSTRPDRRAPSETARGRTPAAASR